MQILTGAGFKLQFCLTPHATFLSKSSMLKILLLIIMIIMQPTYYIEGGIGS
jgi:hypothetical protein